MAFTTGLCANLQDSLNNIMGDASPELKRDPAGYIDAIQSPENTSGTNKIQQPLNGQKRTTRLTFLQRGVEAETTTTAPADCTATEQRTPKEIEVTVDSYVGTSGELFTLDEMRKLCEGPDDYRRRMINSKLNAATVKLNKLALALQAANFGKFLDAAEVLPKSVNFLTADNKPEYFGESTLMEDYSDIGGTGRPLIVGAGNISHYARMAGIGCCNDSGVNMAEAGAFAFYRDRFAGSIFGNANDFVAIEPGSVQLLTWNANKGDYAQATDTYFHDTIIDPKTGIEWDIDGVYDPCPSGKSWKVWLSLRYKLFFLPTTAYVATDDLYQTNGTLHYRATKAA